MSGKRLLDAAALFNASRGIAGKHLAARSRQCDVYSKTSTLARAIKNQTDRVTLTVRAASALAERFNGSSPKYPTQSNGAQKSEQDATVPSPASVDRAASTPEGKQGIEQDHFYKKSPTNTTAEPLHEEELDVKQEGSQRPPLPDGFIPPVGSGLGQAQRDEDAFASPPQNEPSKGPMTERTEKSKTDDILQPWSSVGTSVPRPRQDAQGLSADEAKKLQRQAEKQIPSQAAEPPPTEASVTSNIESSNEAQESGVKQDLDVFYSQPAKTSEVLSALPRVKLPKATSEAQEGDSHVANTQINQDVFYTSGGKVEGEAVPKVQAVPVQEGPSEQMYSELFHSPKVAKMLKRQPREGKGSERLNLPGASEPRQKETKSSKDNDQVTFNSRFPDAAEPANKEATVSGSPEKQDTSSGKDSRKFAQEPAKDVAKSSSSVEVSHGMVLCSRHSY